MTGAELVRRVRAARRDLPCVVISGHEDETFVCEATDAGAGAFLRKRDLVATLAPTIRAVLAEHRRYSATHLD